MVKPFVRSLYYELLSKNKRDVFLFIISILFVEILNIIIFSTIISKFIMNIKHKNMILIFFISICCLFGVNYIYNQLKNKIIVRVREDIKIYLSDVLLKSLHHKYINENYLDYYSPMIKLSYKLYVLIHHLASFYFPYIILFLLTIIYISYYSPISAFIIIISNILMFVILGVNIKNVLAKSILYEKESNHLDYELLECYGNIDKIIYRNTEDIHKKQFEDQKEKVYESGMNYYTEANLLTSSLRFILNISIFLVVVYLYKKNQIEILILILPLLLLYKGKVDPSIERYTDTIEVYGKLVYLSKKWSQHILNQGNASKNNKSLQYKKIQFKDISFSYQNKNIFDNMNLTIDLEKNKIIGIMGKSGRGKSTLMKLLIKNYTNDKGNIYIDGMDIENMENSQLRKDIIYINQNLKLFDKDLKYNLLYGCKHDDCENLYRKISKDNKMRDLFKSNEFGKIKAGSFGENISGGQNQMVNIINGLISKSKILILDEPTRNLDPNLKNYCKQLILLHLNNHKNIIIITHDKELEDIMDDMIYL